MSANILPKYLHLVTYVLPIDYGADNMRRLTTIKALYGVDGVRDVEYKNACLWVKYAPQQANQNLDEVQVMLFAYIDMG